MDHLTLIVPVSAGRLQPTQAQLATIQGYLASKQSVAVKLSKPVKPRSNRQNAYLWGVVLPMIAEYTGHTTEDVHGWFKDEFLPRRFITLGGKEKELRKTTTELTSMEFEAYLERIRAWSAETLGLVIPLPNE